MNEYTYSWLFIFLNLFKQYENLNMPTNQVSEMKL